MTLPKRSECRCLCHTDANILGWINVPMHVAPCCVDDIGEPKEPVESNPPSFDGTTYGDPFQP